MVKVLSAFFIGLLFGLGLIVSQMVNPAKVLAFLDVFGSWDPSLAFVMGGAVIVTFIGYRLVWQRSAPLLEAQFQLPTRSDLDKKLLSGAALFGIGWGLAGYCPGPAITGLGLGASQTFLFFVAMLIGMGAYEWFGRERFYGKPQIN